MNYTTKISLVIAALFTVSTLRAEAGPTVPFTEDFALGTANWKNNANADLTFVASGGPDGSSFVTTTFAFSTAFIDQIALFRGQSGFNSSGGAFNGDWLQEGVHRLTAYVRHDAIEPLDFFVRLALGVGSPAVSFVNSQQVAPGAWTKLDFDVSFSNPLHQNEGSPDEAFYNNVLSQVGRVQIGVIRPLSLATSTTPINYGLDQVRIVPEPSSAVLGLCFLVCGLAFRKSRER